MLLSFLPHSPTHTTRVALCQIRTHPQLQVLGAPHHPQQRKPPRAVWRTKVTGRLGWLAMECHYPRPRPPDHLFQSRPAITRTA